MTDLIERAAADLRNSLHSDGPSVAELRRRGQRRRRRQLSQGLVVVGLMAAGTVFALRSSPSDNTTVSVSTPEETAEVDSSVVATSGSLDPGCAVMPDLEATQEVDAVAVLSKLVPRWQQAERQSLDVPAGVVLQQSPAPGTVICAGTEVLLTVSAPPYEVQPGDTFESIAAANAVTLDSLLSANGRTLDDPLVPGERLLIPSGETSSNGGSGSQVFATIPTTTSAEAAGACPPGREIPPGDPSIYQSSGPAMVAVSAPFTSSDGEVVACVAGWSPVDDINVDLSGMTPDEANIEAQRRAANPPRVFDEYGNLVGHFVPDIGFVPLERSGARTLVTAEGLARFCALARPLVANNDLGDSATNLLLSDVQAVTDVAPDLFRDDLDLLRQYITAATTATSGTVPAWSSAEQKAITRLSGTVAFYCTGA